MPKESLLEFSKSVSKLMPDIMRQFLKRQTKELAQGKISLPQVLLLDVLRDKETVCMGEAAEYLSISMAAATGIVDRLVKSAFVMRSGSPGDRRIVNISITTKGKNFVEKFNHARQNTIMEIFGNLSANDRSSYLEILRKMHDNLKRDKG